jgi:hypothetical protein
MHRIAATLLLLAAACTAPSAASPESGAGLLEFDAEPPAGAATWPQPTLAPGGHFVLMRGNKARTGFTIAADERGYLFVDDQGDRLRRGPDLANLGEWPKEGDEPTHAFAPADQRFHWPLWLGKRWRCQYVDRLTGVYSLLVVSTYVVEDLDSITTAAGTFEALRIVRTTSLIADGGPYFDRVMVIWYAPSIGLEIRQMFSDTAVELVEWHPAAAAGK